MKAAHDTHETLAFQLAEQCRQRKATRRRKRPADSARPKSEGLSAKQQVGLQNEDLALEHLLSHGLQLLRRNIKCLFGEIDLVMRDRNELVWVEVRYRRSARFGDAAASISPQKQARLRRSAAWYLPMISSEFFSGRTPPSRFDVVTIMGTEHEILWLQNVLIY